ncbi:MAG: manganese efflux pump MntP family protein [Desulfotignum sp.]|nr:manganese efflux pump [Desulfobacteraceae bacterium]
MLHTAVTLAIFGLVIGANNLTVALALGAIGQRRNQGRILLVFGGFEFSVPLIGVWLGQQMSDTLAAHADWLGPVLVAVLGMATLISARGSSRDREKLARTVSSWRGLIILSAGLSVDNLVVGFGLGLGGVSPLALAATIMCFSVVFAWIGLQLGHLVKQDYEKAGTAATGLLLMVLAGAMLLGWI